MTLTLNLTPAETELMQEQATAAHTSMESFAREAALKAARNAAYLDGLKESMRQLEKGEVVVKSWAELKAMECG